MMETAPTIRKDSPLKHPDQYLKLGNNAGKFGNMEESLKWYMKGLTLAKKMKDIKNINDLSALIALSL